MCKKIGPFIKGAESIETANPDGCKFYTHLIFFYDWRPAYDYPICLHPKICQPDSAANKYRTEQIGCNLDNCPFVQKVEKRAFSELSLEELSQEATVQLPDSVNFHLAHGPFWVAPPEDFAEKAIWELFSAEEAIKIDELSQQIESGGLVSSLAQIQLVEMIRKKIREKEIKKEVKEKQEI